MPEQKYRVESDLLGELQVPAEAYYGVQTQRALNNYKISNTRMCDYPEYVIAIAYVKMAAATANAELGALDPKIAEAICAACREIVAGKLHDQFPVDMMQGGAGTSVNMNATEVIANTPTALAGSSTALRLSRRRTATRTIPGTVTTHSPTGAPSRWTQLPVTSAETSSDVPKAAVLPGDHSPAASAAATASRLSCTGGDLSAGTQAASVPYSAHTVDDSSAREGRKAPNPLRTAAMIVRSISRLNRKKRSMLILTTSPVHDSGSGLANSTHRCRWRNGKYRQFAGRFGHSSDKTDRSAHADSPICTPRSP